MSLYAISRDLFPQLRYRPNIKATGRTCREAELATLFSRLGGKAASAPTRTPTSPQPQLQDGSIALGSDLTLDETQFYIRGKVLLAQSNGPYLENLLYGLMSKESKL
jgi:hypothetical protein